MKKSHNAGKKKKFGYLAVPVFVKTVIPIPVDMDMIRFTTPSHSEGFVFEPEGNSFSKFMYTKIKKVAHTVFSNIMPKLWQQIVYQLDFL